MEGGAARSFEELHIYQRARELTNDIYSVTREGAFAKDYGLMNQIRRAAVSVMSNIAEGFERGAVTEFIQFLYIAKGSCGEVRAQLQVAVDQQYLVRETYESLTALTRKTGGMISNFIAHLQASEYRGDKFTRRQRQQTSQREQSRATVRQPQRANIHRPQPPGPASPAE